ncbi:MAG: elongation factor Ts [Candidatus Nealsonbacteria bacterium RIFCSPHIGHO2_01_FULL_38_55]|uniref:Elongation factor Ts n=2 Tax=Candidatus Nealsoniibacteriota TaxID=1817911 RepID=A0A1G2EG40_9BACT|nr:MAG: Translation elongation factor Ts [Parcubacteria group bacterium GW2011_GWA2_38_27]KKQ97389.1 MAG: Translation elongation factor Ts [Parcubacteria group bacterium GW2011_GWC2_39_11]OGZ20283.1 MAG: elongation factor Ts [Candidatus Nealsonbacteria bacterium RIFCSPHIGHO2_01_FULL_38_55]OGZ21821.1 MAG: elongation factor Ts [Candidatus Nealsonbacteria bacterium RIFCSPHIGHO2_02_FULL_38_75]OGZ22506.1 MAG: elongation factor Ts [Candidatus Nealsonbacteria bacterium RIFCSPLOWO2_01_FULL_38_120]OGZ2
MVSIDQIKQLREETGVSIAECKKALEETKGDLDKAKDVLRKRGIEIAEKKSERGTKAGIVVSYIHPNNRIGVLIELRCETDFVAKSNDFQILAHELCLQVASMNPLFVDEKDISENILNGEKKIYQEQAKNSGKPEKIIEQIVVGKLKKYKEEVCLIHQIWVKDGAKTIKQMVDEYIAKIRENIVVKRFARFEV